MTTHLDTVHFEAYVDACAERSGIRVQWDEPKSTPRTDGKTLYLPALTSDVTPQYLLRLRYFIKHETSHVVHTKFAWYKSKGLKEILFFICNLLEDNRIDYLNDSEYAGDVRLSNDYWFDYADQCRDVISKGGDVGEEMKLLAPLFVWDAAHRDWIGSAYAVGSVIEPTLDKVGASRLHKLLSGTYGRDLLSLRTSDKGGTDDLLALARRILEEVFGEDSSKYMDEKASPDTSPEGGEGSADGEGEGEGDGKGDKEGEGKGVKPAGDAVDRLITVSKLMEKMGSEHLASRTGVHLKHDVTRGAYSIPNKNEYHVYRWPLKGAPASGIGGYFRTDKVKSIIDNNVKPMAARLRHKLQVRAKGRYEYGTKSGKLHTGSLHRLVSGRGTAAESRVFRKHVTSDTLDTAVSLLVDCSGSMSGSKFEMACAAAASVALALKPLHIKYNVLGFTNEHGNDDPLMWVFNDWQENVTQQSLIERFKHASGCLWENTDGDAIAWAANYLMPRSEERKILIVLSDGSPAGRGFAGDISSYTKKVVEDVEASPIEIYGVGICDTNVKMYYKNNVVINKVEELSPSILSILDKAL